MSRARAFNAARQVKVVSGDFSIDAGIAGAAELLAQADSPTAIFCFNDEMAIGVLDYARRTGRSVPGSLSVVGFDDIRFSRYTHPPLTTVSQPMQAIGQETVRLLLGVLRGSITGPESVTLPHRLEVRSSTGPSPVTPTAPRARRARKGAAQATSPVRPQQKVLPT
jgi:LacI family repressor for deo operon, udp, cdd, tsx, nupC, and nupG